MVGVLLTSIVSVAVGISLLVATDSSVEVGDTSSISEENSGAKIRGEAYSHKGIPSSEGSQTGFQ